MHRYLLIPIACCLLSPAWAGERRDVNEVVQTRTDDPDMTAARRKARDTLDDFLKLAANPPPGTSRFKLKVMIVDQHGTEHFWVTPFRQLPDGFEGELANEPRIVKSVRWGQQLRFTRRQISDWGYTRNGRQVGSFTVCALFNKMPKEQADFYRKNHGFDC